MSLFKPTWKKVIISCLLTASIWMPYVFVILFPVGLGGAIMGAVISFLFEPTTYLTSDLGASLNELSFYLINISIQLLFFYIIVCLIAYFAGRRKRQMRSRTLAS